MEAVCPRTHRCNALRRTDEGRSVVLIGWVQSIRDHGGLCFIDLRDREGMTQLVLDPHVFSKEIAALKPESVVGICGTVRLRPSETVNSALSTGDIEVFVEKLTLHNICQTLPFPLDEKAEKVGEDLRLTYRYLDLRRKPNLDRLKLRHRAARVIRNYLDKADFLEIELPSLFKSTPEGAREFLVPSRLNPGQCYALTQSPQQYKQMLMVAGAERYFSFARCFRDEDLRADRQPEFTQIDLEMSFIRREDIYALIEGLIAQLWETCLGVTIPMPLKRIPFKEAMERFGSDKPDCRFGLELQDVTDIFKGSAFKVFANAADKGDTVKVLKIDNFADMTAGELASLEQTAKHNGAKGLAFIKVKADEWKSPFAKFLSENEKQALIRQLHLKENDCLFFMADTWEKACTLLGKVRLEVAEILKKRGVLSVSDRDFRFLWIVDFPLLTYDEEQKKFLVTNSYEWEKANPDVLDFSQARGCELNIEETRFEKKRQNSDGSYVSYNPPRFNYSYNFQVRILVDHPFFDKIEYSLSNGPVDNGEQPASPNSGWRTSRNEFKIFKTSGYYDFLEMGNEIKALIDGMVSGGGEDQPAASVLMAVTCPKCGASTIPDAFGCCEYCGGAIYG